MDNRGDHGLKILSGRMRMLHRLSSDREMTDYGSTTVHEKHSISDGHPKVMQYRGSVS